jgi:hypothetical protein
MNARMLSTQEAAMGTIGLLLCNLSMTVVFVNTNHQEKRTHILKPKSELEELEATSEDIYRDGLIEKYTARPEALEEIA